MINYNKCLMRHGEVEAKELVAAKKALGSRHWMLHPDWPNKEAHFLAQPCYY